MSRLRFHGATTSRLRAPDDGIVLSGRGSGWLQERWESMLASFASTHGARLSQGRNFARTGRVRGLWLSPGVASAQVIAEEAFNVSLRFRVFTDREWRKVLQHLLGDLRQLGALLDGRLEPAFVDQLAAAGIRLLPSAEDAEGDCDCEDYMLPCSHMAAVHHVVAEALDGQPNLLFTLRGRPPAQWLAEVRRAWGDVREASPPPWDDVPPDPTEEPWDVAPRALPDPDFRFKRAEHLGAGLRALGPAPGEVDLLQALGPLYEAGASSALEMALNDENTDTRDENRVRAFKQQVQRPEATGTGSSRPGLTKMVVDLLADEECVRSKDLAASLGIDIVEIRNELLELEKLGIVYRTGQTRGTRWWLG